MKKLPRLALIFVACLRGHAVSIDLEALEELLQRAYRRGRAAWPQVDLSDEVFVSHLAQVLPMHDAACSSATALAQLIEESDVPGLYLACACVHNVAAAIQILERDFLARLPMLLDAKLPSSVVDEVCQKVRIHLLVGNEARPQLALYKGRGSLLNWIRVIATRMSIRDVALPRELVDEKVLAAIEATPAAGYGAELEMIKTRNLGEFRRAASETFNELPRKQRYLLRLHFIDRLSTIELGRLFGVDQSTISRWLSNARKAVSEGTKRRLKERLDLSSQGVESFLGDIESRLDMSLSELLKEEEDEKLRQTVRELLSELPVDQRHLLRRHFDDRQPPPGIEEVLRSVRQEMKRRFFEAVGLSAQEISNLLGDLDSRIDLLVRKVLTEELGED